MKRAIVLSGGGSKGSYEIGVWKALKKLHISYDIVTGTSSGAINGAKMVEKKFRQSYKLWQQINFKLLFNKKIDDDYQTKDIVKLYGKNIFLKGGMNVENLEEILRKNISSKLFFKSKINYGLITFNLTTKKPATIIKKDIPYDKLHDYIMASATCFPAFQIKKINNEDYIDGGYYDNLPINLAIDLGAEEIIAVNLNAVGIIKKVKDSNIKITYIKPKNDLGSFLVFDPIQAKRNICFGYNDTMKEFKKLDGNKYTFKKNSLNKNYHKYQKKIQNKLNLILELNKNKRILKEATNLRLKKNNIKEVNNIMEYLGKAFNLDETIIYSPNKFNKSLIKNLKTSNNKKIINIYTSIKHLNKKTKKEIINNTILFPKETFAAIYLASISDNYE